METVLVDVNLKVRQYSVYATIDNLDIAPGGGYHPLLHHNVVGEVIGRGVIEHTK